MRLQDIHFAFPQAAYLIGGVFFLLGMLWMLFMHRRNTLNVFARADVLKELLLPRSEFIYTIKALALGLAWLFAVFALMEPMGSGHYPTELTMQQVNKDEKLGVRKKPQDVILLIDASTSMSVNDTRSGNSRLDAAKDIADEVISRLTGQSVALHAFTSAPVQLSPLTMDYLFVRLILKQIQLNEGGLAGTSITNALKAMQEEYFSVNNQIKNTIILLSDGGDTQVESLTGADKEKELNRLLQSLEKIKDDNLRVITIGMGSIEGRDIANLVYEGKPVHSSLDEDLMQKISQQGNGKYFKANDFSTLDLGYQVVKEMGQERFAANANAAQGASNDTNENLIYPLFYQIPLALAILCLMVALLVPDALKIVYSVHFGDRS